MGKVKIKLNSASIIAMLKSSEITHACESAAQKYKDKLGGDYELSTHYGPKRVNVSVYTTTKMAYQDNLDHNTMLKSLG